MNAVAHGGVLPLSWGDLAGLERWVAWQTEDRKGKLTKLPYAAVGTGKAKANDPQTWGIRAQAERVADRLPRPHGMGGVGVELGDLGDGRVIAGVDLDTCRDLATGAVAQWALDVVDRLTSYAEVSPSGTGAKVFFVVDPADLAVVQPMLTPLGAAVFKQARRDHPPAIEVYMGGRFFAVTGQHMPGTPPDLRPVPLDALQWLLTVAGPQLATGRQENKPAKAPHAASGSRDNSRSALAYRRGCNLIRDGKDYTGMKQSMRLDPELREWLAEKGEADGERELRRIFQKAQAALLDLTEDGIAQAFAARHAGQLRYCHDAGSWYTWTGAVWRPERTKLAFSWARHTCRDVGKTADPDDRAKISRASVAAAVERFAQADRAFAVTSEVWDRDPFLLGTPGGTVDLKTAGLHPARQQDFITKQTAVAPAAAPDCPLWLAFLQQATAGDDDLSRFLRQWCGYTLTGDTQEHALLFGFGPGGNGKSVFLNTVANIMGDYARIAAMETFAASQGDRHPTDLAMLRGARLVCANETEEGRAWAEVRIKQLTGGDTITARFMRQDFFEFRPQFSWW